MNYFIDVCPQGYYLLMLSMHLNPAVDLESQRESLYKFLRTLDLRGADFTAQASAVVDLRLSEG